MKSHELSAIWIPNRDCLIEQGEHEAIRIRLHRALSWLKRAEECDADDYDGRVIFSWIALNSLYGESATPGVDQDKEWQVRAAFLEAMVEGDANGRIQSWLKPMRSQCDRILSEEHLYAFYWSDPSPEQARRARSTPRTVGRHYHDREEVIKVLLPMIDRISLLRNQLMHGLATCGSSVNRHIVEPCADLIEGLVGVLLQMIIEDGLWECEEAWDPVPYPPSEPVMRRDGS
ncbi:MAG: hypothetical protein CMJ39_03700 [Phycisphaerae bacterium]|nr:hypothetical protein [Phycisphaerae bacterium]